MVKSLQKSLHGRSFGAVLLSRTNLTQADLAAQLGVSEALVSHWGPGRRVPTVPNRKALLDAFGIPLEAWDQPAVPEKAARPRTRRGPLPPSGEMSVRATASKLRAFVSKVMARLDSGELDKASLETVNIEIERLTRSLLNLGRITGEVTGVSQAAIVRHPEWGRIERAIIGALDPWPEALRAAGEAVQKLAREDAA